jgi:hypothetical protein
MQGSLNERILTIHWTEEAETYKDLDLLHFFKHIVDALTKLTEFAAAREQRGPCCRIPIYTLC